MAADRPTLPPGRARRWRALTSVGLVLAAAVAATALATGTDMPGGDTPRLAAPSDQGAVARDGDRQDTVATLLSRRAAAVRDKDRAAFLGTVDPRDEALRAEQGEWFDNLVDVPFEDWTYTRTGSAGGSAGGSALPAAAAELIARAGVGSGAVGEVVEVSYRIAGYDHADQTHEKVLTFARRGGQIYLSGTFDPVGERHRDLWDVGRVNVLSTRNALVLGLPPVAELRPFAREVERAVPRVSAVWGTDWSQRALVLVTRTENEMAALLGGRPATYAQLAAVTRGELGAAEGTAAAERVIVNPKAYAALSPLGRQVIMAHEIAHVAVRAHNQSWTPVWLAEGLADYVGYRDAGLETRFIAQELVADVEAGFRPARLPTDADFAPVNTRLPQAYELAWLACRMIVERYGGQETLVRFFRAVGAGSGDAAVEAAFRDVLSTTVGEFTTEWRSYVRSELT